jgi:hypothetical protein
MTWSPLKLAHRFLVKFEAVEVDNQNGGDAPQPQLLRCRLELFTAAAVHPVAVPKFLHMWGTFPVWILNGHVWIVSAPYA